MRPRFIFSEAVHVVCAIHNDSTYTGLSSGALLARRDSIGYVRGWGVFLQDQIIYQIHFPNCDRVAGCYEQELTVGDRPWLAGNLQCSDSVICQTVLATQGGTVAGAGQLGRIEATGQGEYDGGHIIDLGDRWPQIPVSAPALAEEEG